ncbi:B3 domain-containing protein_Os12g40080-like [Miscanthus floridulus]|uniref:B3 domain-containing protein_Os12g40080-like n=1 Tax=Miscanthus floridulus TaxID=154761 RepID=UPI0034591542
MGFIRHNKLQEGDNCIFQSSKSKKGVKLIYHPLVQSRRLQPQGYVPSAKSPRHGVAKPPYMLPWKTSLTDEQRSKVEEKVGAIQSEIPVYVTVMKNSNVNSRLCILGIGSEYATKYLPGGDENQLTTTMRLRCPGRSKDDAWSLNSRPSTGGIRSLVKAGGTIHGAQLRQPFDFADASSGADAEEDKDFIRVVEYIERAPLCVCGHGHCAVERDEQRGRWVYVCPSQSVSLHSPPQLDSGSLLSA